MNRLCNSSLSQPLVPNDFPAPTSLFLRHWKTWKFRATELTRHYMKADSLFVTIFYRFIRKNNYKSSCRHTGEFIIMTIIVVLLHKYTYMMMHLNWSSLTGRQLHRGYKFYVSLLLVSMKNYYYAVVTVLGAACYKIQDTNVYTDRLAVIVVDF